VLELGLVVAARNLETVWSAPAGGQLVLTGWTAKEASGGAGAVASVDLVDDAGNTGRAVDYVVLAALGISRVQYPRGLQVGGGRIALANIVGTLELTLYLRKQN
jgi:hypothetical protein